MRSWIHTIRFFYVFLPFFSEIYPTINWVGLVKVLLWNWRDWKSWIWPTTKSAVSTEMPWQVSEVFVTCKFPIFLANFFMKLHLNLTYPWKLKPKFSYYVPMYVNLVHNCWQKCPGKSQKSSLPVSSPFFLANFFMKLHLNFHLTYLWKLNPKFSYYVNLVHNQINCVDRNALRYL